MHTKRISLLFWLIILDIQRLVSTEETRTCGPGKISRDVTLIGGMNAGHFIPVLQQMRTLDECINHCCLDPQHDLVFKINDYCFCVKCDTPRACQSRPVPRPPPGFNAIAVSLLRVKPTNEKAVTVERKTVKPTTLQPTERWTIPSTRKPTNGRPRPTTNTKPPIVVSTSKRRTEAAKTTFGPPIILSVTGYGNMDIILQCPGKVKVTRVVAFSTEGDESTISKFQEYCQKTMTIKLKELVCQVSLARVFGVSYPDDTETIISYQCTPGTV